MVRSQCCRNRGGEASADPMRPIACEALDPIITISRVVAVTAGLRRRRRHFLMTSRTRQPRAVVLSIAGYDPSSGAGITADIKTIAAHACYGITCMTAITVQSTLGVKRVEPIEGSLITEILNELA